MNKVRFSGCIFEIENNFRALGKGEPDEDTAYSALKVTLDKNTTDLLLDGNTILVGDHWPQTPSTQHLLFIDFACSNCIAPPSDELEVCTNNCAKTISSSSVTNLLIAHKAAGTDPGFFAWVPNLTGITFGGNVWPEVAGTPFRVGLPEAYQQYDVATWTEQHFPDDVASSTDRATLVGQAFKPNRCAQQLSFAALPPVKSFGDYFGNAFPLYGASGAVAACVPEFVCDGFVDGSDYDTFQNLFEALDPAADINHDGFFDGIDLDGFTNAFEASCP